MKRPGYRLPAIYVSIALCLLTIGITEQADAQGQAAAVFNHLTGLLGSVAETQAPTAKPAPARTQTPTATPTPAQTQTPKPTPSYSKGDLNLLARVVYAEAGSDWCSDEMQLLVANVVINRMRDRRFPDTLRGVVYQRGQYACAYKLGRVKPNARAVKNAKRVLDGERFCPAKVVYQSEFRQGKGLWKKVGNQYFCY